MSVSAKLSPEEIKAIQEEIESKSKEIELKRNQIKKETQFNKQVDINVEINGLREEIKELESELSHE